MFPSHASGRGDATSSPITVAAALWPTLTVGPFLPEDGVVPWRAWKAYLAPHRSLGVVGQRQSLRLPLLLDLGQGLRGPAAPPCRCPSCCPRRGASSCTPCGDCWKPYCATNSSSSSNCDNGGMIEKMRCCKCMHVGASGRDRQVWSTQPHACTHAYDTGAERYIRAWVMRDIDTVLHAC